MDIISPTIHVQLWSAYLCCLCCVVSVLRAACPENAVPKAMRCTRGLGLGPPGNPNTPDNAFVQKGQIQLAIQACREERLIKAVDCLEEITEQCQGNSDQEHFLQNMIDVRKARDFVTYFCGHLPEYEVHAPCIAKMHDNQTSCVQQQRQNMLTKVKASSNMDFLMVSTCKYFNAAELCSKKILTTSCSAEAADMVARVFTAFQPPKCATVTYASGDAEGEVSRAMSRSSGAEVKFSFAVVAMIFAKFDWWKCFLLTRIS